jgi:hypothetical protein
MSNLKSPNGNMGKYGPFKRKGGCMRRLIVTLAAVFAICSAGSAGVGVSVDININRPAGAPEGYEVTCNDDDMFRDELFVINAGCVGFWAVLPTGDRVLHCRNMWYDRKSRDWYYGPWREDRTVTWVTYRRGPYYNVRFHDYMNRNYPRYYDRRFHQEMMARERRHDRSAEHERTIERKRHAGPEQNAPGEYGRERNDNRDKNFGPGNRDEHGTENRGNQGYEKGREHGHR